MSHVSLKEKEAEIRQIQVDRNSLTYWLYLDLGKGKFFGGKIKIEFDLLKEQLSKEDLFLDYYGEVKSIFLNK